MPIVDFDSDCWADPWVQSLKPLPKLLFIYLWTNAHRNISGIYVITEKTIAFETGLNKDQIPDLLRGLFPKVYYDFEHSVCWVVKHARRQFLRTDKISPKQREGIRRHVLKLKWHRFFKNFCESYPEIFSKEEVDTFLKGICNHSMGIDTLGGGGKGKGEEEEKEEKEGLGEKEEGEGNIQSHEITLSKLLFQRILERDPKAKEPNWKVWFSDIRLLIHKDHRDPREIEEVINWCQKDSFWQNNILSPGKLREQFTQLKLKMNKQGSKQDGISTATQKLKDAISGQKQITDNSG